MTGDRWRDLLGEALVVFAWNATAPRLAHRLREPTRPGPAGLVLHIARKTLTLVVLRALGLALIKRLTATQEHAASALREQLGREPTRDEVVAHLAGVRAR